MVLSYTLDCRGCEHTIGTVIDVLLGFDAKEYLERPEFEVVQEIWETSPTVKNGCPNCGSKNLDVYNVEVDYQPIFDYKKILKRCESFDGSLPRENFIVLDIEKEGSQLRVKTSGQRMLSPYLSEGIIKKMHLTILTEQDAVFVESSRGQCLIAVTATFLEGVSYKTSATLERFRSVGISREDALRGIEILAEKCKVQL